ncbi:Endonuclease/exonuclease/phosphatase [Xylaria sp. FL0043]|nr:Endonuclease/exonuclease/phosphatase [Xylaria sp. FL0043]
MATADAPVMEVNILTLNCWGIPFVSQEYSSRLAEIGRHIAKADPTPHIVGLQECFFKKDFEHICQETRHFLPYTKHYSAGPFGTGLAILSRWPIENSSMIQYPLNGHPTAFYHGDWYIGKGVACATIRYGKEIDDVIDVFNTHMHASYSIKNDYLCHRVGQAWEFAKLLQAASQRRHGRALVIGLGDLNTEPNSLPWRILKHFAVNVYDTWLESPLQHKALPETGEQDGNVRNKVSGIQDGATYGSPYNTWQWTRAQRAQYLSGQPNSPTCELMLPPEINQSQAIRIDYVLASVASQMPHTTSPKTRDENGIHNTSIAHQDSGWVVLATKVGMLDRHPVLGCSLSDHFSVEVTLAFQNKSAGNSADADFSLNLLSGPRHVATSRNLHVKKDDEMVLEEVLRVLGDYELARQQRNRWEKIRLGAAGVVLIGSLAGVWVVERVGWARLLLGITGALALTFAVAGGYGGLLFNCAETAALQELTWEVSNMKQRVTNDHGHD